MIISTYGQPEGISRSVVVASPVFHQLLDGVVRQLFLNRTLSQSEELFIRCKSECEDLLHSERGIE